MAKQTALQNLTDLVGTAPDVQPVAPKEAVKVIAGKMLTTMPEKLSALKAVEAQLDKQFDTKNSLIRLGSRVGLKMPHIATGITSLDEEVFGIGGVPRGRVVEVYGPESCLSEDTFVQYTAWNIETGTRMNHKGGSIKRLYERFHGISGKGRGYHLARNDVYFTAPSINEDDRVFHNIIEDVIYTGQKQCLRITLNDGRTIESTPEHKFFCNGRFIEAGSLYIGSNVFIHNQTPYTCEYPERVHRREFLVKYHPVASTKIIDGKYVYYRLRKSRAVVEASMNGLTLDEYISCLNLGTTGLLFLQSNAHVHHLDEDCTNDDIDNLLVITASDHGRLHAHERHNNLRFIAVERTVVSIENIGPKETYDIKMKSPFNNYVANDFIVHNSGKTTVCLEIIAADQRNGNLCAFVDAEHALDPNYASQLGVDVDNLYVSQPDYGEQALEAVIALVESRAVTIVVVDSVAALVPKAELDGEMGDSHMGLQARLMSQAMRKLVGICAANEVTVIFINQLREKIGVVFGNPETTTGGRALKFYSSIRLDVRRDANGNIKEGDKIIGHRLKIKATKNRVATPFRETVVNLVYGKGIDRAADLITYGETLGVITKSGAWYAYKGERLGNGLANAESTVGTVNSVLSGEIRADIKKALEAKKEK